ncbi:Aste57867_15575 [Aphanomyces stellatus]|uniref:Aste57867_15575 protein n=1 Tax=Aphanomyces stellatus TaxID=120398 RepID=A0A485L5B7_9STRA|nr:hypothetical protein As57867_015519 [Aphanomyces stellatus]VFT92377.1 Aste57867_15575 [Aphanomyces stellatus]
MDPFGAMEMPPEISSAFHALIHDGSTHDGFPIMTPKCCASIERSNRLMKNLDFAEAVMVLSDAIRNNEAQTTLDHFCLHYLRSACYKSLGQYALAVKDLSFAITKVKFPDALHSRGDNYMYMDLQTEALADFNEAISLETRNLVDRAKFLNSRGSLYLKMNQVDLAMADFTAAIDANPSNPVVHFKLSRIYTSQRQFDQALLHLNIVVATHGADAPFYVLFDRGGILLLLANQADKKEGVIQSPRGSRSSVFALPVPIPDNDPLVGRFYRGPFQSESALAFARRALQELTQAAMIFDAIRDAKSACRLQLELGCCRFGLGQYADAMAELYPERVPSRSKKETIELFALRAVVAHFQYAPNVEPALLEINKAMKKGWNAASYFKRAQLYVEIGAIEKAIEDLTAIVNDTDQYGSFARLCRARIYLRWPSKTLGLDKGIAELKHLLKLEPENAPVKRDLLLAVKAQCAGKSVCKVATEERIQGQTNGNTHLEAKQRTLGFSPLHKLNPYHGEDGFIQEEITNANEGKASTLENMLVLTTHVSPYKNTLQICTDLMEQAKYADAITAITDALRQYPRPENQMELSSHRGTCYSFVGEYKLSIRDFTAALALQRCPSFLSSRSYNYCLVEQYQKAIADLSEAISLNTSDVSSAQYFAYRGSIHARKNQMKLALQDFNAAINLDPKQARVFIQRSRIYFQLGSYDLALRDLDKCIKKGGADATFAQLVMRGQLFMCLAKEAEQNRIICPPRPHSVSGIFSLSVTIHDPFYGLLAHGPYQSKSAICHARRALECFNSASDAMQAAYHDQMTLLRQLGYCFLGLGKIPESIVAVQEAMLLGQSVEDNSHNLLTLALAIKYNVLATTTITMSDIDISLALTGNLWMYIKRAELHLEQGSMEKALADLNTIVAFESKYTSNAKELRAVRMALLCRARIYLRWPSKGASVDEAIVDLKEILKVEFDNVDAMTELEYAEGAKLSKPAVVVDSNNEKEKYIRKAKETNETEIANIYDKKVASPVSMEGVDNVKKMALKIDAMADSCTSKLSTTAKTVNNEFMLSVDRSRSQRLLPPMDEVWMIARMTKKQKQERKKLRAELMDVCQRREFEPLTKAIERAMASSTICALLTEEITKAKQMLDELKMDEVQASSNTHAFTVVPKPSASHAVHLESKAPNPSSEKTDACNEAALSVCCTIDVAPRRSLPAFPDNSVVTKFTTIVLDYLKSHPNYPQAYYPVSHVLNKVRKKQRNLGSDVGKYVDDLVAGIAKHTELQYSEVGCDGKCGFTLVDTLQSTLSIECDVGDWTNVVQTTPSLVATSQSFVFPVNTVSRDNPSILSHVPLKTPEAAQEDHDDAIDEPTFYFPILKHSSTTPA